MVQVPFRRAICQSVSVWLVARGINLGLQTRIYFDDEVEAKGVKFKQGVQALIEGSPEPGIEEFDAFIDGYRSGGGPAIPATGDPWDVLEPLARAAVLHAAAVGARYPADESQAELLAACRRFLDRAPRNFITIEYCMRIYSCVEEPGYKGAFLGRFKQAKSPSTLIDFLAILPFFLEVFLHHLIDLRFLRVFRLARLLKLTRGSDATAVLVKVVVREWPVMGAATFIMMLLLVLTASLGYLFEYDAQPEKFENIPTSIYWAVITLASVGYGDISPVTPMGRAMTSVLALLGIGIFAIPAALLADRKSVV